MLDKLFDVSSDYRLVYVFYLRNFYTAGPFFPTIFIHCMSLCHILVSLAIFQILHQQKDYNLLKAQMMVRILKQQTILKLSYAVVLLDMHCILNKQQYSVNIIFICSGKPKTHVTYFTMIFSLPQSLETKTTLFPRYACN